MDTILITCQLLSLPVGALYALLAYPVLRRHQLSWYGVLLWLISLVLLVVWVIAEYQGGVYADEHQTNGNVLDDLFWLYLAVLVATSGSSGNGILNKIEDTAQGQKLQIV